MFVWYSSCILLTSHGCPFFLASYRNFVTSFIWPRNPALFIHCPSSILIVCTLIASAVLVKVPHLNFYYLLSWKLIIRCVCILVLIYYFLCHLYGLMVFYAAKCWLLYCIEYVGCISKGVNWFADSAIWFFGLDVSLWLLMSSHLTLCCSVVSVLLQYLI